MRPISRGRRDLSEKRHSLRLEFASKKKKSSPTRTPHRHTTPVRSPPQSQPASRGGGRLLNTPLAYATAGSRKLSHRRRPRPHQRRLSRAPERPHRLGVSGGESPTTTHSPSISLVELGEGSRRWECHQHPEHDANASSRATRRSSYVLREHSMFRAKEQRPTGTFSPRDVISTTKTSTTLTSGYCTSRDLGTYGRVEQHANTTSLAPYRESVGPHRRV